MSLTTFPCISFFLDIESILRLDECDDSTDLMIPKTLQGSVLALKHMLNNELVFNAGHYNKSKVPGKEKVIIRIADLFTKIHRRAFCLPFACINC